MLTIVDAREGTPLAVVRRKGRPRRGDTVWIKGMPFEVTGHDRDTVSVVRTVKTDPPGKGRALYAVNPPPSRLSGYRIRENPDLTNMPSFHRGPIFQTEYGTSVPSQQVPTPIRTIPPHMAPAPTFISSMFSRPYVYNIYHDKFRFPIFRIDSYRPIQIGERDTFNGIEYEYVHVQHGMALVRPVVPWVAFVVAEDKRTGDAIAWVPITNFDQVSYAKRWLKRKIGRAHV